MMRRYFKKMPSTWSDLTANRRGVFLVVGAVCMIVVLTFIAFSVDLGVASLTKSQMQSAVDAAALAAAMEITDALANSGASVSNVFAHAQEAAKTKAAEVAAMNNVYVDASKDVTFGRRFFNHSTNTYSIDWNAGASQTNVVKVCARRDGENKSSPDAKVPTIFAGAISQGTILRTEATAFIDPRDIVVVHDLSRSMNFDSYFTDETNTSLTQEQIESNLQLVWDDLQPLNLGSLPYTPTYAAETKSNSGANATVTYKGKSVSITTNTKIKSVKVYFENSGSQTFTISGETTTSGTWSGTGSNSNKRIDEVEVTIRKVSSSSQNWTLTGFQYDSSMVTSKFGLSSVSYPYDAGSWSSYVSFVKTNGGLADYGYQDKYGGMTFLCYLMKNNSSYSETKDLWKTRHYPFHAIKEGHVLLCSFLSELGFDDHLGMVTYDTNHRIETTLSDPDMPSVDISSEPLTNDYESIRKLMYYKQASHYSDSTNMSGGMESAIDLLDNHKRDGSRPAIILMTDGNGNVYDSDESDSMPAGWSWDTLFDYNGDGQGDYEASSVSAKSTLKYVKQAVDKGYTVHCISVGIDADRGLLKAAAWLGNGYYIDVPGGQSVSDMEDDVRAAFTKIAAAVPPARLVPGN